MPTESRNESHSLTHYMEVLRRRRRLMVAVIVTVPLTAVIASSLQEAKYEATSQVLLSRQNLANQLTGTQGQSYSFGEFDRYIQTQADLATSPTLLRRVSEETGGVRTPTHVRDETSVEALKNTDLLRFTVTDRESATAMRLATAYAEQYVGYRRELDTASLVRAREQVTTRLEELRVNEADTDRSDEDLISRLSENEQQLRTLEALQTSNASVIPAAFEASQVQPRPLQSAVLGLLLGAVLAVGIALLRDATDTRVRSDEEISGELGLPMLARIPGPSRTPAADGLVMLAEPNGLQAESIRMLRTNFEFANLGPRARTVMVTSAVSAEGKSTTISNLAVALARADRRVTLVDLDLRRPLLASLFQIPATPGVTSVALGHATLDEALEDIELSRPDHEVSPKHLQVLTAGPLPPDPGEFVGSEALAKILDDLRERSDIVLVDTPPILAVGDAMTLSSHLDGLLVITMLGVVRRPMLAELSRQLRNVPTAKLGFVVTGTSASDTIGYGYGYGYGYGESSPRTSEAVAS